MLGQSSSLARRISTRAGYRGGPGGVTEVFATPGLRSRGRVGWNQGPFDIGMVLSLGCRGERDRRGEGGGGCGEHDERVLAGGEAQDQTEPDHAQAAGYLARYPGHAGDPAEVAVRR